MTEREPIPSSFKVVCDAHGTLAETATMERVRDIEEHHRDELGCYFPIRLYGNVEKPKTKQDWGMTWD